MKTKVLTICVVVAMMASATTDVLAGLSASGTLSPTWGVWETYALGSQYSYRDTDYLITNDSSLGTAAQGPAGYAFSGSATLSGFDTPWVDWSSTPYLEIGLGRGLNSMDEDWDGVIEWDTESYTDGLYVVAFGASATTGYEVHLQEVQSGKPGAGAIYSSNSALTDPFSFTFDVLVKGGQGFLTVNSTVLDPITLTTGQNYDTFFANVSDFRGVTWWDGTGNPPADPGGTGPGEPHGSASYSVVPEPATICLLGLGGLSLIRRRKRA